MADPKFIEPGDRGYWIIEPDKDKFVIDNSHPIPAESLVSYGLPAEFDLEVRRPYDPSKKIEEVRALLNTQTKISLLEKALKHFAGRGMDFLLVDPLTCQTIIMGKDSNEELMEYVSCAFVRAAPMVKRT